MVTLKINLLLPLILVWSSVAWSFVIEEYRLELYNEAGTTEPTNVTSGYDSTTYLGSTAFTEDVTTDFTEKATTENVITEAAPTENVITTSEVPAGTTEDITTSSIVTQTTEAGTTGQHVSTASHETTEPTIYTHSVETSFGTSEPEISTVSVETASGSVTGPTVSLDTITSGINMSTYFDETTSTGQFETEPTGTEPTAISTEDVTNQDSTTIDNGVTPPSTEGLTGGEIAAIVICSILGAAVAGTAIGYLIYKNRNQLRGYSEMDELEGYADMNAGHDLSYQPPSLNDASTFDNQTYDSSFGNQDQFTVDSFRPESATGL